MNLIQWQSGMPGIGSVRYWFASVIPATETQNEGRGSPTDPTGSIASTNSEQSMNCNLFPKRLGCHCKS